MANQDQYTFLIAMLSNSLLNIYRLLIARQIRFQKERVEVLVELNWTDVE